MLCRKLGNGLCIHSHILLQFLSLSHTRFLANIVANFIHQLFAHVGKGFGRHRFAILQLQDVVAVLCFDDFAQISRLLQRKSSDFKFRQHASTLEKAQITTFGATALVNRSLTSHLGKIRTGFQFLQGFFRLSARFCLGSANQDVADLHLLCRLEPFGFGLIDVASKRLGYSISRRMRSVELRKPSVR